MHRLPGGALGNFVLLFILLGIIANSTRIWDFCYLYSNPGTDDQIRMEAQLHIVPQDQEKCTVLITGSSQTREGFDIDYLNNRFTECGAGFYNLGLSGNGSPIQMYMITDRLIDVKPDVIVYMPFVGTMNSNYSFALLKYGFEPKIMPYFLKTLGVKEIFDKQSYFIDAFTAKYIVVFKYRESIQRIISNFLKAVISGEYRSKPTLFAYEKSRPGSYYETEISKAKGNRYNETRYTQMNKSLFTLFAEDVLKNDASLIVITGPTHPKIKKCYKEALDTAYDKYFNEQARELGFIYISEKQLPKFTEQDFIDFTHLNATGRNKLSAFLGDWLLKNNMICVSKNKD